MIYLGKDLKYTNIWTWTLEIWILLDFWTSGLLGMDFWVWTSGYEGHLAYMNYDDNV